MKLKVVTVRKGNAISALISYMQKLRVRVETGLLAAGQALLAESDLLVPKDTEALRLSGGVRAEGNGFDIKVIVGYGRKGMTWTVFSPNERKTVTRVPFDYAVRLHEGAMPYPPITGVIEFLRIPTLSKQSELIRALNQFMR